MVNIHFNVKIVKIVKGRPCVFMVNENIIVNRVAERVYVNTTESDKIVYFVADQIYAHIISAEVGVYHVMVGAFAPIKK
jgi:hypothetical protein